MPLDPELLANYDALRESTGEDAESICRRVEVNADDPATAAELRKHFGVKGVVSRSAEKPDTQTADAKPKPQPKRAPAKPKAK